MRFLGEEGIVSGKPTAVVKVSKRTREVVAEYRSATQAAKDNGTHATTIVRATNCLSAGEFYYRAKDGFDPSEELAGGRNCPVIARDERTGQVAWYCDVRAASEKLNVPRSSIYKSIHKGRKVMGRITFAYCGKRIA